uniref:Uncharacterized protein n=1 Tax=Panagrolaimus davidi TaxID=227884 RepID=A0A914QPP0_9BILA
MDLAGATVSITAPVTDPTTCLTTITISCTTGTMIRVTASIFMMVVLTPPITLRCNEPTARFFYEFTPGTFSRAFSAVCF